MAEGEFNPNSYDAVLSSINTQLKTMNTTLEKMQSNEVENNKAIQKKIDDVEKKIDTKIDTVAKSIVDVNNKVVALEYFRYYLVGFSTAASAIGGAFFSFIANKWFGGGGGPTPPHA